MHIKRRALYNLLQMNWVHDKKLKVEPWQIEDYRLLSEQELFDRLKSHDLHLDRKSFLAYAENYESPELLTEAFFANEEKDDEEEIDSYLEDQAYLLIFELWRRYMHVKLCLSVFCDELDYQINLHDRGEYNNAEALQDVLSELEAILDENVDQGTDPIEAFEALVSECANDVETFLYDFIAEEIDSGNYVYASELTEGFFDFVKDVEWFEFLRARILSVDDAAETNEIIKKLIKKSAKHPDLELNLEILAFLVHGGLRPVFMGLVKQSIPLLKSEEDFQDLLMLCADYYSYLDHDAEEREIQLILKNRGKLDLDDPLNAQDADIQFLQKMISRKDLKAIK